MLAIARCCCALPPCLLLCARLPHEAMAAANFGKIQIGIYVEIKRSDGQWGRGRGRGRPGGETAAPGGRRRYPGAQRGVTGRGLRVEPIVCAGPIVRTGPRSGWAWRAL